MVVGLHVPVIPLSEVAGSPGAVAPSQIEVGTAAKIGVMLAAIAMFTETGLAHEPADGVNV